MSGDGAGAIWNKIAYLNGLKVGVGSNYIEVSNAGELSFNGTASIAGGLSITGGATITGDLVLNGKIDFAGFLSGAESASGLLMGVGTSGDPAETSTADAKFVELRCKNTSNTGDNRLAYLRFEQSGSGAGGGEAIRAFSKITGALGTCRGAHISLDLGESAGAISGLGVGVDSQLLIGDAAETTGTLFALQGEIYMAGSSSDLPATHAIVSIKANGDATGVGNVLNAIAFAGSTGSGKMIYNNNSTGATESNGSIRILVDEGSGYEIRYLRYWDAENS
jgi:hypothetical protein